MGCANSTPSSSVPTSVALDEQKERERRIEELTAEVGDLRRQRDMALEKVDRQVAELVLEKTLKRLVRPVKGFPNPEFVFGDITPLLANAKAFSLVIDAFVARYKRVDGLTAVASPESRGFFFGPAVAKALGVGFLPIRKMNQLPAETHQSEIVKMDYGERCMEIHAGLLPSGGKGKVIIVDDILATGGSAIACAGILEQLGMTVHEVAAVFDYSDGASVLPGRGMLKDKGYGVFALARFCVEDRGSVAKTMSWWLERGPDSDVVISPHMGKMNKQH